jgi:hypothetical protein
VNWLDAQAEGIALALVLGLLGILALLGAWCVEWLVTPRQRHDHVAERHGRITDNARRVRAGMRAQR